MTSLAYNALKQIAELAERVCDLEFERNATLHLWTGCAHIHDEEGREKAMGEIQSRLSPAIWRLQHALTRYQRLVKPPAPIPMPDMWYEKRGLQPPT